MQLAEKRKKRRILAALAVVCIVFIAVIAWQFEKKKPEDAVIQPSPPVSEDVSPITENLNPPPEATIAPEISPQPIDPTEAPAVIEGTDTADSSGTEQSLQTEPIKPEAPTEKPVPKAETSTTDPSKAPEYEQEDTVKTQPQEPSGGEKKDGKIYVPGFGWIDDEGGGVKQETVGGEGDINKQVGDMN